MSNIKYTTDGRKVAVIGQLNSREIIVQEVFVNEDGSEIPAGEQFIVKGLLDKPAKTWKEKKTEEIEAAYTKADTAMDELNRKLSYEREAAKERIKAVRLVASNAASEQLDVLEWFVAGEITHILEATHGFIIRKVEDMDLQTESGYGRKRVEGTRLLGLFGKSDGSLDWTINQYRDGSGYWTAIIPCRSRAEAVNHAQRIYDERVREWKNGDRRTPPSIGKDDAPELVADKKAEAFHSKARAKSRSERIIKLETEIAELKKQQEENTK